jgi:hypothetical protein
MLREDITSIILENLLNKAPRTMKLAPSKLNEVSSRLINKHHDQWCRDNGYRIRGKVGQYGHRYGRNVSKKRQMTDSVYAAKKK